ncbi:MAG: glutamyl-tRNA reductase [Flavobacteriales bacterium]|nr:glutamyl-tRNA reductase [Flavobacteriales bacterium]
MLNQKEKQYYLVGLSYKKADVKTRGEFSLSEEQQLALLNSFKEEGYESVLILSTCNRTEISGFVEHPYILINKLCNVVEGSVDKFLDVAYILKTEQAINHLYRIVTGLDSQILGDYEIIGQLKRSVTNSKKIGGLNAFTERLFNSVIKTSKRVKNETLISSGVTSVAYAATQYLKDNVQDLKSKKIVIFGVGEIGKNSLKNVLSYTDNKNVILINRTYENAQFLADQFDVEVRKYENLKEEVANTDVLIVATGSQTPTIRKEDLPQDKEMYIVDLSVPRNVDVSIDKMPNKYVVDVDYLSVLTEETKENRLKEVPKVESIIEEEKQDFIKWVEARKFAPVIKMLKQKLNDFQTEEINYHKRKSSAFDENEIQTVSDRINQKIIRHFATYLHTNMENADTCIHLVKEMFNLELESAHEKNKNWNAV